MPPPLPVTWQRNTQNNEWFDLLRLNLDAPYFYGDKRGVFVVWYVAQSAKVIKVGSGSLGEQLQKARTNPQILDFSKNGPLKVSWVAVNGVMKEHQIPGVEAYLINTYSPLIAEKSSATPIPVTLIQR